MIFDIWTISLIFFLIILFYFFIYLYILDNELLRLENSILIPFQRRMYMIPSIFEISKKHINKHDEVYKEIVRMKWLKLSINKKKATKIHKIIRLERTIKHEIDFIFKICEKYSELSENKNFIHLKNNIKKENSIIKKKIKDYKKLVLSFNKLITIKNFTIIWLMVPIDRKEDLF